MLNISKTIYAAHQPLGLKYELPEAEVIPIGQTLNEKKRLTKLAATYSQLSEHANIPLPGFTLYKSDRKTWGSIDQTWLVIDPRGFLVRITSQNLEKILHTTGITEGLIQEKCVWARKNDETKIMLVPISSQLYLDAVKNTQLLDDKIEMKNVQIGDTVLLQNNLKGVYMGTASLYGPLTEDISGLVYKPRTSNKQQIIEVSSGKYFHRTDLKILKVLKNATSVITSSESIKQMNSVIRAGNAVFSNTEYQLKRPFSQSHVDFVNLVIPSTTTKIQMAFVEVTSAEVALSINSATPYNEFGKYVLCDDLGTGYLVEPGFSAGLNPPSYGLFDVLALQHFTPNTTDKLVLLTKRKYMYDRNSGRANYRRLSDFKKFYKIVKCIKNETYI